MGGVGRGAEVSVQEIKKPPFSLAMALTHSVPGCILPTPNQEPSSVC